MVWIEEKREKERSEKQTFAELPSLAWQWYSPPPSPLSHCVLMDRYHLEVELPVREVFWKEEEEEEEVSNLTARGAKEKAMGVIVNSKN